MHDIILFFATLSNWIYCDYYYFPLVKELAIDFFTL